MKLGNFLAHDPDYHGSGLMRGNKLEKIIWEEFASNPQELREVATAIRSGIREASRTSPLDQDDEFPEGDVLSRIHRTRERNRKAVAKKKRHILETTGKLACEVCGFDFHSSYGELGKGFAECHHNVPLAELPERKSSRLQDLSILCANCHRMIHKTRPVLGLADFRALVRGSNRAV
jgi:5-methylcytosine-specific restriction protein A